MGLKADLHVLRPLACHCRKTLLELMLVEVADQRTQPQCDWIIEKVGGLEGLLVGRGQLLGEGRDHRHLARNGR